MAINTEYSRLLFKRSTVTGVEPTVPTGTTIDNTWLTTDIMVGEIFMNTADDRLWIRGDSGIKEIAVSGTSFYNYTTGATLVGNTVFFDTIQSMSAYSVDLSALVLTGATGGEAVWFSGDSGTYSIQSFLGSASGNYAIVGGTSTGTAEHDVVFGSLNYASGSTTFIHGDVNTSGAQYGTIFGGQNSTLGNYTFAQGFNHEIQGTTNHSAILGGSGNVILSNVDRSVILGGTGLSATTDDTVYVDNLNIGTIGTGTSINNLGIDSSGNVVVGSAGGGNYLPLSGGIFTAGAAVSTSTSTASYASFSWGVNNSAGSTYNSFIGGGYGNSTTAYGNYGFIGGGSSNTVSTSQSAVIGGANNTASGGAYGGNVVIGGTYNTASGYKSAVIGGQANLASAINSVVIGGTGITGTTDNSVYVPKLNVGILTGASTSLLGIDSNGFVVSGATYGSGIFLPLSGGTITGNLTVQNTNAFNVDVNGLEVISVGTGLTATANVDTYGTIISSRDSRINPSVVNSAVIAATGRTASANNTLYTENLNVNGSLVGAPCDLSFAISDETSAISSGLTKFTLYSPYSFTITNVYASLSTSGSTSSQFNVNKNGTTIFSTPLTIDANEFHSKDASTPAVITGTTVTQFDKITVDIDSAGSSAAGAKIYIIGKRTL